MGSISLINQIIWKMLKLNHCNKNQGKRKNKTSKIFMENIIKHFKYWQDGFKVKKNFIYSSVESPKGEFGVFLLTNNSNKPFRCKIKSPAYSHLQFLNYLCKNIMLADLVTLIGTIDIVLVKLIDNEVLMKVLSNK